MSSAIPTAVCAHCRCRFAPSLRGRTALYCGPRCRQAAHRSRIRESDTQRAVLVPSLLELVADLRSDADELTRLLTSPTVAHGEDALQSLQLTERRVEALRAGLVGHLRNNGSPWRTLASLLSSSEDAARRRYTAKYIRGRLSQHGTTVPLPKEEPAPSAELYDPAGQGAAYNQLAPVLSRSVRELRLSQQGLAARIGCSPSYLYRVLGGERMPSWALTEKIGRECGEDLTVLQTVWEHEKLRQARVKEAVRHRRNLAAPDPTAGLTAEKAREELHRAILTLWRSMQRPTAQQVALVSRSRLSPEAVDQILKGRPASWELLAAFLAVTGGHIPYFRQWWEAAGLTAGSEGG